MNDNQFFEQIRRDLQYHMDDETFYQIQKAVESYWVMFEEAKNVGFSEDQAFELVLKEMEAR